MQKLSNILKGVQYSGVADSRNISGIFYDSRKIKKDSLFIAIKGFNVDGHNFIDQAIELGANAILLDQDIKNKHSVPFLKVKDSRKAMSKIASNFFGDCSKNISITGITGTNGKTSITHLINYILKYNDYATSSLGTLGFYGPNGIKNTGFTTPESIELQNIFSTLVNGGVTHLNMEISSHSIALNRIDDVDVDIAIFTNLTRDHLDFHKNMDEYFAAKLELFKKLSPNKFAIINSDDSYSDKIKNHTKSRILTYGFNKESDIYPINVNMSLTGSKFEINYKNKNFKIDTSLVGNFNISNILASILACDIMGVKMDNIIEAINQFNLIPGRFESYRKKNGGIIIVDYAHTPDAFEKILSLVRSIQPSYKITTLFGCGGDRDKDKRSIMGSISEKFSDNIIITDDNPRYEDPNLIINHIVSGFSHQKYVICNDRKKAIEQAFSNLDVNQVLLILGKGVEDYQINQGQKTKHSDTKIIKELL